MSVKKIKDKKNDTVIKNTVFENKITVSDEQSNQEFSEVKTKTIKDLTIEELLYFEKACSLICRRYEISARLDNVNNKMFQKYNDYYQIIIQEIENKLNVVFDEKVIPENIL